MGGTLKLPQSADCSSDRPVVSLGSLGTHVRVDLSIGGVLGAEESRQPRLMVHTPSSRHQERTVRPLLEVSGEGEVFRRLIYAVDL